MPRGDRSLAYERVCIVLRMSNASTGQVFPSLRTACLTLRGNVADCRRTAPFSMRSNISLCEIGETLFIAVLENFVGFVHDSRPHSVSAIMSLRGVERRSNLSLGQLKITSGFALSMTIFQSIPVIKTDLAFENPYTEEPGFRFSMRIHRITAATAIASAKSFDRFCRPVRGLSNEGLTALRCPE